MKPSVAFKFVVLFLFFAGSGCEEAVLTPTFTIGAASEFRPHLLYTSSDGLYTFRIKEIYDSRCPEGAQCVWSGEIFLKGEWVENRDTTRIELHSVMSDLQKLPVGFNLQIQGANPYPKLNGRSNPDDLLITILVTRVGQ
jgi:hypothetical protein